MLKQALQNIKATADSLIAQAESTAQVEELRVRFLGKKGELTAILKQMGKLSARRSVRSSARWPTKSARRSRRTSRPAPKSWSRRRWLRVWRRRNLT